MGNKYGAVKVEVDGYDFASKREAARYFDLKMRRLAGEIVGLVVHPSFNLIVNGLKVGSYTADFGYVENGKVVVDEEKGYAARDWPLRSRLFMALNPDIELRINGVAAKKPKPPKSTPAKPGLPHNSRATE